MAVEHLSTSSPLADVSVLDAMHPGVVVCLPDDPLARIAAIMVEHVIHAVLLPWAGRRRLLIVTDLDLVRAALAGADARAGEIAREPVESVPADAPLTKAVSTMAERYVTHLLVSQPGSPAPAGIISSLDVVAVLGARGPRGAPALPLAPALPPVTVVPAAPSSSRPAAPSSRPAAGASELGSVRVGDVMRLGITTSPADVPLGAVARTMAEHRVHCVAVAGIGRPGLRLTWGLIEALDLVRAAHRGALSAPAANIATTEPVAVTADESLSQVATLMVEHDTSHVVVVGHSGLPTGIISTFDVARVLAAGARSQPRVQSLS
jgi:CBS domain-containing protein